MSDPHEQLLTIKRIDDRQEQVLEDLDRLNQRIENIIEVFNQNRQAEDLPDNPADTPSPDQQDCAA